MHDQGADTPDSRATGKQATPEPKQARDHVAGAGRPDPASVAGAEAFEALKAAALSGDPEAQAQAMQALQAKLADSQQGEAEPAPPIDWSTEPTPASANGLQIMHLPTEFALFFTDMTPFPGRRSPDGTTGNERAVIVGSYRVHPDTFFQMLCVMASNWNRFASTMIDPRMRQPKFKLLDAGDMQLEGIAKPSDGDS